MKKYLITFLLTAITATVLAQTPYDEFAPEVSRQMLGQPLKFELVNTDSCAEIKRIKFDIETSIVTYFNNEDSIIEEVELPPTAYKWLSVDPAAKEYPSLSPYNFVGNNPINAIDPDGQRIVFVNGFTPPGTQPLSPYWGQSFISGAQNYFNDYNSTSFVSGSSSPFSSGQSRYSAGYDYAKANIKVLTAELLQGETFKVVTHSQGAAYGAGITQYLIEQGYKVENVLHLSPHQTQDFSTPENPNTLQLGYQYDPVSSGSNQAIQGVDRFGVVNKGELNIMQKHGATSMGSQIWNEIGDLKNASRTFSPGFSTLGKAGVDNTGVVIPPSSAIQGGETNFSKFEEYPKRTSMPRIE